MVDGVKMNVFRVSNIDTGSHLTGYNGKVSPLHLLQANKFRYI